MKFFKSKEQRNGIIVVGIICLLVILQFIRQHLMMNECSKFTVGEITKISYDNDSSTGEITFIINMNKKKYSVFDLYGWEHSLKKGERYFLETACHDPYLSEACWDIKVPDTLQFIPENGWDKIPYGLDKGK